MVSPTDIARLEAARSGDAGQFTELAEPLRRELQAYCYRLLGSLQDAEDVVQETMLRAWRRLETFEGRASFRAWLYKIATNAALDVMDRATRRALPVTLYPPADPAAGVTTVSDPVWLDPFPDEWLDASVPGAEAHYLQHESITLAFMTALQVLPPRQRAVLVLCDVLDWRAREAASLLDMTLPAVKSALHRARASLEAHYIAPIVNPALKDNTRALLDRYVRAWEAADMTELVALLKEDVAFAMPPSSTWFQGRDAIRQFFAAHIFVDGLAYRLQPVRVSGQPGFAAWLRYTPAGAYHAHAIHVLAMDDNGVVGITAFLNPALFAYFGLPETL